MALTKLENMVDPEVMAPIISGKIETAIVVTPFAKIDTTLAGQPGSTVTVPRYKYIGDAEDLAEGVAAGTVQLTTDTAKYTVKKAVKHVQLTDEAVLSGFGNPVGETNSQLAKSIASKVDMDCMDALQEATLVYNGSSIISYEEIVKAIDLFNEEVNTDKVMFISPTQTTQLRLDPNFISADKYDNNVIMTGEIGKVANARIVPSRKIVAEGGKFSCPIVQLNPAPMTDDDTAALTIYLKRDTNVETERNLENYTTRIGADKHYVAALTDESKVVLASLAVS
jgi:hypothetical protein